MPLGTPNEKSGRPLLDWLLERYPDTPKTRAKQWIVAGRVRVDGVVLRRPHEVLDDPKAGLELLGREAQALNCGSGWQIHPRVSLLHLDGALAVVNKGPGLISVPAPNCDLSALSILADFLEGKLRARDRTVAVKNLPSTYRNLRPLPVHRLDQYTSGVFCMGMNPAARSHLIDQLKEHHMQREYLAFADGRARNSTGTWRNWVQLSHDEMVQQIVPEPKGPGSEAQEAITHFEVIAEYPLAGGKGFVTKLRLRLETGRKHQIRVQAAHAGLPLLGDRRYHPNYREPSQSFVPLKFPRQALHAETLSLEHPERPGTRMSWRAELPKDLRELEAALRRS